LRVHVIVASQTISFISSYSSGSPQSAPSAEEPGNYLFFLLGLLFFLFASCRIIESPFCPTFSISAINIPALSNGLAPFLTKLFFPQPSLILKLFLASPSPFLAIYKGVWRDSFLLPLPASSPRDATTCSSFVDLLLRLMILPVPHGLFWVL